MLPALARRSWIMHARAMASQDDLSSRGTDAKTGIVDQTNRSDSLNVRIDSELGVLGLPVAKDPYAPKQKQKHTCHLPIARSRNNRQLFLSQGCVPPIFRSGGRSPCLDGQYPLARSSRFVGPSPIHSTSGAKEALKPHQGWGSSIASCQPKSP